MTGYVAPSPDEIRAAADVVQRLHATYEREFIGALDANFWLEHVQMASIGSALASLMYAARRADERYARVALERFVGVEAEDAAA